MKEVNHNSEHLTDFVAYFTKLKGKVGCRERQTELNFDDIEATKVVLHNNKKLYVNREGFVGTSLKKKTRYRLFGYR
jgi:hypothetical protein